MRKIVLGITLWMFAAAAMAAGHADNGLVTKASANSVSVTIDRLESKMKSKGITIFKRVDHAAGAKGVGITMRPTTLLIFGNPKLGSPLMTSSQTAAIDLPLKAIAYEDANGKVWLSYNNPAYIAKRHGIADRAKVIKKMTGALNKFSTFATKAP